MDNKNISNKLRIIGLSELEPEKIQVRVYQWWVHHQMLRKLHSTNRKYSSLLLIVKGSYKYDFASQQFEASAGDLIYIPHGSVHTYSVTTHDVETIQIEFDIIDIYSGDNLVFSKFPVLYKGNRSMNFFNVLNKEFYSKEKESAELVMPMEVCHAISDIYNLLSYMISLENVSLFTSDIKQIYAAIQYINENYTQKIKVSELAEMCFLSESQLRRLFRSKVGMSPIEYKNNLCIKSACDMLKNTNNTIKDISSALGFESASFFSRVFTKIKGMSPKQYHLKHRKE